MRLSVLALGVLLTAMPATSLMAGSVYKWTDENGVTHYGDQQPRGKSAEQMRVKPGTSGMHFGNNRKEKDNQGADNAEAGSGNADQAAEKARAEQALRSACQTIEYNLNLVKRGGRIKAPSEDGEVRYLSSEEINQKRDELSKQYEEQCSDLPPEQS